MKSNITKMHGQQHIKKTTIHIALSYEKISQIKNSNTTNVLHKRQLHIIKQMRRKLIKIINNNENS